LRYDELLAAAENKLKEKNLWESFTCFGAENGYTRKINQEYFKTIALKMRVIDAKLANTRTNLFGKDLATPIIAGAMSNPRIPWIEYHFRSWAVGMKEAGSMMGIGIANTQEFEETMEVGVPTYRISKPFRQREKIVAEMKAAEAHGAVAVGTDIDFIQGLKAGEKTVLGKEMAPLTSDELLDLRKETKLPLILKGILHESDAEKAIKIGANAIVVSNHRSMVLDHCVHSLEVLANIRKVVGKKMTILVDGGFMRGVDVLKALALGADGVLVGQAILLGLIADGAAGVKDMILDMTAQLQRAMTLTGCPDVHSVDESILLRRNFIIF
jgi:4-hydroxymandelate oxidase